MREKYIILILRNVRYEGGDACDRGDRKRRGVWNGHDRTQGGVRMTRSYSR